MKRDNDSRSTIEASAWKGENLCHQSATGVPSECHFGATSVLFRHFLRSKSHIYATFVRERPPKTQAKVTLLAGHAEKLVRGGGVASAQRERLRKVRQKVKLFEHFWGQSA